MRSLWAYIEGMDGLCLLFTGTNSSDLAAWARFGTLALFEGRLLLQYVWVQVNSSLPVATLHWGPMRSLWAYIEGMDGLHLLFKGANGSNLAAWARFGTFWPSSMDVCSSSIVCLGASQFFYACCNIVFGTHGEPLGIY